MRFIPLALSLIFVCACSTKKAVQRDNRMVETLMEENEAAVVACYEKAAKKDPKLGSGKIVIRVDHNPDGTFSHPFLRRQFARANPLVDCLSQLILSWKTKSPYTRGPVDFSWTFDPKVRQTTEDARANH